MSGILRKAAIDLRFTEWQQWPNSGSSKQKGPANTGPFLDRSFDRPYSLQLIAMNKVCRINTSGSLSFHKMEN